MKLKIDPTQIRFRLTASEAEKLLQDQVIAETIVFPLGKSLSYLIKISDSLTLNYAENTLILTVSVKDLQNLIQNPSKKGLSSSYQINDKNMLFSLQIDTPCDFNC